MIEILVFRNQQTSSISDDDKGMLEDVLNPSEEEKLNVDVIQPQMKKRQAAATAQAAHTALIPSAAVRSAPVDTAFMFWSSSDSSRS